VGHQQIVSIPETLIKASIVGYFAETLVNISLISSISSKFAWTLKDSIPF
jgi:hypothetical protein